MQRQGTKRKSGSRERLVKAADQVLRRNGYGATAISDIVRHSGAPVGSVYFHFPGGKEQLALEAMRLGGDSVAASIVAELDAAASVADGLRNCALSWADDLERSNWVESCPVTASALYANAGSNALCQAGAEILAGWIEVISDRMIAEGATDAEARRSATAVMAMLEGAEIMSRILRSREPLESVASMMQALAPGSTQSRAARTD